MKQGKARIFKRKFLFWHQIKFCLPTSYYIDLIYMPTKYYQNISRVLKLWSEHAFVHGR